MHLNISQTHKDTANLAAQKGANIIKDAIRVRGEAFVILATGASQFGVLDGLINDQEIDWSVVTLFHLDEYVGIADTHKASFVRFLKERFLDKIKPVKNFVSIHGDTEDITKEIQRVSDAISGVDIDVAFVGIGENSHLAFNDPPADFDTLEPYIHVKLDEKCRLQQANEGWFETFNDVPKFAISMGIQQILKSSTIVCTVLDTRKAEAAKWTIEGEVSSIHPASILQTHDEAYLFLDQAAASNLSSAFKL